MIALGNTAVNSHAAIVNTRKCRFGLPPQHLARLRRECAVGVFDIQARLNGVTHHFDIHLSGRQWFARRHAQLPLHQVIASDHLRHRMLNLQAGIHLQKVVLEVFIHDELHCACALVAHRQRGSHRIAAHSVTHCRIDDWRGRFLNHFLSSALRRAIPLTQVHGIPVRICKNLNLDMPAVVDQALQHQVAISKSALRLAPGPCDGLSEFILLAHQAHPAPATARHRLHQQRETELAGFTDQVLVVLILAQVTGCARHTCCDHAFFCQRFITHGANSGGWRADEDQPGIRTRLSKVCVFTQKSIPWMDRIGTCFFGRIQQFLDGEVRLGGSRRANVHSFVSQAHMRRVAVCIAEHSHRGVAERASGTSDATGDLAAIANQDLRKAHGTYLIEAPSWAGVSAKKRSRLPCLQAPGLHARTSRQPRLPFGLPA